MSLIPLPPDKFDIHWWKLIMQDYKIQDTLFRHQDILSYFEDIHIGICVICSEWQYFQNYRFHKVSLYTLSLIRALYVRTSFVSIWGQLLSHTDHVVMCLRNSMSADLIFLYSSVLFRQWWQNHVVARLFPVLVGCSFDLVCYVLSQLCRDESYSKG